MAETGQRAEQANRWACKDCPDQIARAAETKNGSGKDGGRGRLRELRHPNCGPEVLGDRVQAEDFGEPEHQERSLPSLPPKPERRREQAGALTIQADSEFERPAGEWLRCPSP